MRRFPDQGFPAMDLVRWLTIFLLLAAGCAPAPPPQTVGTANPPAASAEPVPGATAEPSADRADDAARSGESRSEADEPLTDYTPLVADSRWDYDVVLELPLAEPRQTTGLRRVEGRETIDGKSYFKVLTQITGTPFDLTWRGYCRETREGLVQILEGEEDGGEWLFVPAKLEVGQRWSAKTKSNEIEFEVLDFEDVTCPKRVYHDCLQLSLEIKTTFGTLRQHQWLAPGVGVVQQIDESRWFKATWTLTRHEP